MERKATITRRTRETDIRLTLGLDSREAARIFTGVPFFDHMLNSMAKHGRFHLDVQCSGDTEVDDHHTVEDVGICLGKALQKALGDKAGIARFGDASIPMDDALAMAVADLSGRAFFRYSGRELKGYISAYSEELTMEFLRAVSSNAEINLHVLVLHGENSHHVHEAIFKALGVALRKACAVDASLEGEVPSTKGTIG
jgi:imidazoleglycerol-phosphate dehydratase